MRKIIYSEYVAKVEYNDGSIEDAPRNYVAAPNKGGFKRRFLDPEEQGEALFHGWGVNYEEFESGAGNFSTAIIELEDGTVKNIPAEQVRFISGPIVDTIKELKKESLLK